MLARGKLNSIETLISQALINSEINYEDFMTIIDEEINYRELKEIITKTKRQRSDSKKSNLIEKGKIMGVNEIIRQNSLKPQVWNNDIILFKV